MERVWTIIQCAKEFGMSPSAAALELDTDPSGTMLEGVLFLRYAEAKAALESKHEATREAAQGHPLMKTWSLNTFWGHHVKKHPEPEPGCKLCHQMFVHPTAVDWCEDC